MKGMEKTKYLVFQCAKCRWHHYARAQQKGTKCPKCKKAHLIENVQGTLADGVTEAFQKAQALNNQSRQGAQGLSGVFASQSRFKPTRIPKKTQNPRTSSQKSASLSDPYRMFLQQVRAAQKAQYITERQGIALSYLELLLESHGFDPAMVHNCAMRAVKEGKAKFSEDKHAVYVF